MSSCNCHSDIVRDGSGQLQRYLKALDPSYAPIDGRSMEDLLVFAKRYAKQIRFYDVPESKVQEPDPKKPVATWREFFRRDMAVIAASIAVIDLQQIKKDYDETRARLEQHPSQELYTALYTNILGMAARIDKWYGLSLPDYPLRKDLQLGIASSLRPAMQQILSYEKGYPLVEGKALKLDYSAIENATLWGLDAETAANTAIYAGATPGDKILHAALFTEDVFLKFYGYLCELVDGADAYLQFALQQYPQHQPHMALFIAFLELFRLAQDQMNGLTGRMLDFYYRDVLRLSEQASIPDRVHIIFELAKGVSEYELPKGTGLTAGKDASGKEQLYTTEQDFVVNSAKVKELKTLFIQKSSVSIDGIPTPVIRSFFAMPVANSADGQGAAFPKPPGAWPSLGTAWPLIDRPKNVCEAIRAVREIANPPTRTRIGFAIASPQLLLQGGKRLVRIAFDGLETLAAYAGQTSTPVFELLLSAEKEWLQIEKLADETQIAALEDAWESGIFRKDYIAEPVYYIGSGDGKGSKASLNIYLPLSAPPVIAYDAKLHPGSNYPTTQPVLQVLLNEALAITEADYQAAAIGNLMIEIKVGSVNRIEPQPIPGLVAPSPMAVISTPIRMDGLRTLILQNDEGLKDPFKPFDPFTAYPFPGKSLYIGSSEVFNKTIDELAIDIQPTSGNAANGVDYRAQVLYQRQWVSLYDAESSNTFTNASLASNIYFSLPLHTNPNDNDNIGPLTTLRKPIGSLSAWTGNEEKGFIRLDLEQEFNATGFDYESVRNRAPGLEVKALSVSYHSVLWKLEPGIDQLFHVYPFGVAEVSLQVRNAKEEEKGVLSMRKPHISEDPSLVHAHNRLLPQFTYTGVYDRYKKKEGSVVLQQHVPNDSSAAFDLPYNTLSLDRLRKLFTEKADQLMLEASGLRESEEGSSNQYSGALQEEGMLFIGLEGAQALQTVSLLFQFAEGTAIDEDRDPPALHWTYLVHNEWRPLPGESIVADDTFGFQTTGIVRLEIPRDATATHSIITDGLYWFGVSVTEHADRFPKAVDVVAQAALARFEDSDNDPGHFEAPLAPGSIAKLKVAAASVAKVSQPFASFDGKQREHGTAFYTRASERLRHKGRAITSWDYEHLVLDRFPSIYKVKCIQHTDQNCLCREPEVASDRLGQFDQLDEASRRKLATGGYQLAAEGQRYELGQLENGTCCGPQVAPGHVLIVAIPSLKNRNDTNPLQPRTSRRSLLEIETYLKKRASPFVHIHARNPVYEEILVFFRVQFYPGVDKGFSLRKLNEEIVRYLTPWAFDDRVDVAFGKKIYASAIINFIEERPYVDFITDFVMNVCRHECCSPDKPVRHEKGEPGKDEDATDVLAQIQNCNDMEALLLDSEFTGYVVATPSTPRSILVSAPRHIIIPYEAPPQLSPCEQRQIVKAVRKEDQAIDPKKDKVQEDRNELPPAPVTDPAPPKPSRPAKPLPERSDTVQPVKETRETPEDPGKEQAIKRTKKTVVIPKTKKAKPGKS